MFFVLFRQPDFQVPVPHTLFVVVVVVVVLPWRRLQDLDEEDRIRHDTRETW